MPATTTHNRIATELTDIHGKGQTNRSVPDDGLPSHTHRLATDALRGSASRRNGRPSPLPF
ncbi:hypothetical protein CNQ36_00155 [Streptomyces fungicidicus]|uniref:Uncharacterized protein n=1 Tax=Streptomyces fungicidicus TaxID=68203 RepID=A0A494UTI5_9ACTN|nr:hypothetical protein CNQ36_00155 [Streptomyces fungicidicus]